MTNILDSALGLAALGLPVFPLRLHDKRPACEHGHHEATTDAETIARLFANPLAGLIGVPAGDVSGFDAIDVDLARGGGEWLAENEHRLPKTRRHHSRSGGVHLLLQHSPGMRTKFDRIAPGVEVRGEGGYIAWWPAHGCHAEGDTWAPWPEWLLIAAMRGGRPAGSAAPAPADLAPPSAADLVALLSAMPNPEPTTRGDYVSLNLAVAGCIRALESLGRCDQDEIEDIRDAAAEWCARWESDRAADAETERARWESDWGVRTNDVSGWRHVLSLADRLGLDTAPQHHAAAVAEFGALPVDESRESRLPANHVAAATEPARGTVPGPDELTEESCARGFASAHVGRLAHDHTARKWYAFDGAVWGVDKLGSASFAAREYVSRARAVFGNTDKAAAGISFAANVERAARSDPRMAVSAATWDRDPWLLGVPGGMVDLRTGALLPGDPGRYISRQCSVAPAAPGTPTPRWSKFLGFATAGDADLQSFLQRLVGYCLTGDVTEEALAFFYGAPGTGKGTLLHTVSRIVGEYGYQAPAELFKANPRGNPEYQLAKLAGRRAVFASETEGGTVMAEALIKEITGNEGKINARLPFGEPFEFDMQGKLILVSNYAPRLRGRSEAMERRLRVVPFEQKPPKPDPGLKAALVAEYPAILRWAIDGCLAWQSGRLGTCAVVQRASAAYFEEQDAFGRWVAERLEHGADLETKRTDLYGDYTFWARSAGEAPISAVEFYETMRRSLGCQERKSGGVRYMRGIAIQREAELGAVAPDGATAADLARLVN